MYKQFSHRMFFTNFNTDSSGFLRYFSNNDVHFTYCGKISINYVKVLNVFIALPLFSELSFDFIATCALRNYV